MLERFFFIVSSQTLEILTANLNKTRDIILHILLRFSVNLTAKNSEIFSYQRIYSFMKRRQINILREELDEALAGGKRA